MLKSLAGTLGVIVLMAALSPAQAYAQGEGDVEVFAGGTFFNLNLPLDQNISDDENLKMLGLHGSLVFYLSDKVGIVFDGTFPRGDVTIPAGVAGFKFRFSQTTYLGGIQYRFSSRSSFRPSLQGMVGWHTGTLDSVEIDGVEQPFLVGLTESGIAAGVGVNFDLSMGTSLSLRLLHLGILWTGYQGATQASPRVSVGIVGRF